MHLKDTNEVHEYVISEKQKGTPISKTLITLGIPRCTYYKLISRNGNETWRELSEGKMIIKKDLPKKFTPKIKPTRERNMGISGGSLQPPKKEERSFMEQFALDMKKDSEIEKEIRALDIHGQRATSKNY